MKILDRELLERKIDDIAMYDIKNNNLFGSSYFVYQNKNVVLKKHYGVTGDGKNVNDRTIFRLASMTKPITAVAMMILEEEKLISLSDPVSKYLPDFKKLRIKNPTNENDTREVITEPNILSLLTHSSGFGISTTAKLSDRERADIGSTVNYFIRDGLKFEPFSAQEYSAYGAFDVLAAIAEKVTGEDYGKFLEHRIFMPCGMLNTTFSPTKEQEKKIICMHEKVNGGNMVSETYSGCVFENFPYEHKLAGAGLLSTLDDYAKFAVMLLNRGKTENGEILSAEEAVKMSKPYVSDDVMPGSEKWGLGVRVVVDDKYGDLPAGAFGWSGAYGSHFWIDPENDICAVFMKNSRFDGGAGNSSARRFERAVFESLK